MSPPNLVCTAHLAPQRSGPAVRIAAALMLRNLGTEVCYVPDPHRGTRALSLQLSDPSGGSRSHVVGDETPPHGTQVMPINRALPAGGEVVFDVDLTRYFELSLAGRYRLDLEFRFDDGTSWRSPPLEFERSSPAGSYLAVTAVESAGYGYHTVLWRERGVQRAQLVVFDDDGRRRDIADAEIVADNMPIDAEVVMAQYPAGLPFSESWLAWIAEGQLGVRFYAHGDPELGSDPRHHTLPPALAAAQLVAPMLADRAPDEGRPHFTAAMISGQDGTHPMLSILRLAPDGSIQASASVALPGRPVGSWAIAPREDERYVVIALEIAAGLQLVAYPSHTPALIGSMQVWHTESAGSLMAGDVRADLAGRVLVGLLVSTDREPIRVTFAAPATDGIAGNPPARDTVSVPAVIESVCARLDVAGRLHLVYGTVPAPGDPLAMQGPQPGLLLHHVGPGESVASWSSPCAAAVHPWSVRLILRPNARPFLVAYDADSGPFRLRI